MGGGQDFSPKIKISKADFSAITGNRVHLQRQDFVNIMLEQLEAYIQARLSSSSEYWTVSQQQYTTLGPLKHVLMEQIRARNLAKTLLAEMADLKTGLVASPSARSQRGRQSHPTGDGAATAGPSADVQSLATEMAAMHELLQALVGAGALQRTQAPGAAGGAMHDAPASPFHRGLPGGPGPSSREEQPATAAGTPAASPTLAARRAVRARQRPEDPGGSGGGGGVAGRVDQGESDSPARARPTGTPRAAPDPPPPPPHREASRAAAPVRADAARAGLPPSPPAHAHGRVGRRGGGEPGPPLSPVLARGGGGGRADFGDLVLVHSAPANGWRADSSVCGAGRATSWCETSLL